MSGDKPTRDERFRVLWELWHSGLATPDQQQELLRMQEEYWGQPGGGGAGSGMKYRLVKETTLEGNRCDIYRIERKVLWWWEFVDCSHQKDKMLRMLILLRNGHPLRTSEVIG